MKDNNKVKGYEIFLVFMLIIVGLIWRGFDWLFGKEEWK